MNAKHEEAVRDRGCFSKMLFHPRPEAPEEPNAVMLIVQYPGPVTGGRPIYDQRFNMGERRPVAEERTDL